MDGKKHRHKPRRHLKKDQPFTDMSGTSASEYVRRIKKLVEDYEQKFGSLPKAVDLPEAAERAYRGTGFLEDYDDEPCVIRSFMRDNPKHKGPIWIACPCRRCSIQC